jgi:hypothetical protein
MQVQLNVKQFGHQETKRKQLERKKEKLEKLEEKRNNGI